MSAPAAAPAVDKHATISNPATTVPRISVSFDRGKAIAQLPHRAQSKAEAGARLTADGAAVSRALRLARGFAASTGLDPAAEGALAMVVEEWVGNVVEHGGPQDGARIVLRLSLSAGVVRLAVSDAGRPFDPRSAAFEGPNPERGGGAGLAMIASLCSIASYVRRAGRNRLVLELPLA
ncbi:MAG: ATP-binding protein [Caulobacterales bacterium]